MAVKTRWDKKTYRRHMFNRGRKVPSPHDAANTNASPIGLIRSQNGDAWWEAYTKSAAHSLSARKEYEQYNMPMSLFSSASSARKNFREQDRKEVRKLFAETLKGHHFAKDRKVTQGRVDKIVDAYMSQDDDKFKATLAGMGIPGKDVDRWLRAAEESASVAIGEQDAEKLGTSWADDNYVKPAANAPGKPAETAAPGTAASGAVANGQSKASGQQGASGQPGQQGAPASSLKPRNEPVGTGPTGRRSTKPGIGLNTWNGAIVPNSNNAAQANIAGIIAAETQAGRDRAVAEALAQNAVSSLAPGRAFEERENERERIEQIGKDRRARQAAEREAAARQRANKRYESRTLYNEDDWKNLGREGSNRADYSDRRIGESDQDWGVREQAIKERQGRMADLLKRLDTMGVQDKEKNSFYANDPGKQQNLARLRQLVVGTDGKVRKDITDAQMEGVNATLDAWEKGANERGARNAALREMSKAEEVSRLRDLYGLQYTGAGGYTGDEVLKFHQDRQAEARKRILQGMQVAPGLTPAQVKPGTEPGADHPTDPNNKVDMRPAAMLKFSQDWQKLIDNGFNPTATFNEAMTKGGMRDAYDAGMKTLDVNDPDYRDKADQLRRRFTIQYAMQQAGVGQEGGGEGGQAGRQIQLPYESEVERAMGLHGPNRELDTPEDIGKAMAQNLPGKAALARNRADAEAAEANLQAGGLVPRRQPQQVPGVQIVHSMADAIKARDAANAAAGVPLKRKNSNGGMLS